MRARRKQQPISIRSDRAAARLKQLTRDGRSQSEVIEEALERMPLPKRDPDRDEWLRRIGELVAAIPKGSIMTMEEFDALEYDENGDLR